MFIFRRLKTNHDSHEFILESGTVANMYEFEYFKCEFVRIEYKINGLVEVESASFFLSPLIAYR
jgi:hypothetical protein